MRFRDTLWSAFLCFALAFFACGCPDDDDDPPPPVDPAASLLWSLTTLTDQIAAGNVTVLDCRTTASHTDGTTYIPYNEEHITGSYWFDFFLFGDPYITDMTALTNRLEELGITTSTRICLYDAGIANPQGKVFYNLERLGCTDVHMLDGGFPAWKTAGGSTSTTATTLPTASTFVASIDESIHYDLTEMEAAYVARAGGDTTYALIDYREPELYWGHKICPDAIRHGYMPNSTLLDWHDYFDSATSLFKTPSEIETLTVAAGGSTSKTNVLICNKGWRTGIAYFALRYIGWPKSCLVHYVGGIREWAAGTPATYPMDTEGCYRRGTSMGSSSAKRFAGCSAQIGDVVYCIGGYTANATGGLHSAVVQSYDISANTWTTLTSMPEAMAFSAAAAVGNYIYVFGGLDSTNTVRATVYVYDTVANTWDSGAVETPLPTGRFSYSAAAVGAKIYLGGGLTATTTSVSANYSDAFYEYDTVAHAYATLPVLPHTRRCHAFVADGNNVYLVGGYWYDQTQTGDACKKDLDDLHVINTSSPTSWTALASLPSKIAGHSAVVLSGKIYVPGGWRVAGTTCDVYVYDIAGNSWVIKMKTVDRKALIGWPRYWYFLGASGTDIPVLGGYSGGPGNIPTTPTGGMTHYNQAYIYDLTNLFYN